LASYHLEEEANQWWQWLHKTFQDEGRVISWAEFKDELWLALDLLNAKILMKPFQG